MAGIIRFSDYKEIKQKKAERDLLYRDDEGVEHPEFIKSFSWVLDRMESNAGEIYYPDTPGLNLFAKNSSIGEFGKYLEDDNYICALFDNPQIYSCVFYAKPLKPSTTGDTEKFFVISPVEVTSVMLDIFHKYGARFLNNLSRNAAAIAGAK